MGRLADNLTEMVRRLFLLLALVIVVAACTNGSTTTSTDSSGGTVTTTSGSPETTSEIPEGTTTTVAPTWTELPGLDALPQEIQDELLELVRLTEEVRDLKFSEPPTITIVTNAELEERVRALIEEDAEDCFRQAIAIAQKQEAKSLELRAATSLAQLWQGQGKQAEARDLLAPVYDWFTEGFDTADLKDAKALLEAVS